MDAAGEAGGLRPQDLRGSAAQPVRSRLLRDKRKYRKFTAKQKVELVLASFRGDRSIAEICREHDISETLLRRWRDQMVEAAAERLEAVEASSGGERRALDYFGEVLVEEDPGDELLA